MSSASARAQYQQHALWRSAADFRAYPGVATKSSRTAAPTPRTSTTSGEADEAHHPRGHETFTRNEGKPPKVVSAGREHAWTPDLLRKRVGVTWRTGRRRPADLAARAPGASWWCRTRSSHRFAQIIHRHHTAREFCDMLVDQFEEMIERARTIRWCSHFYPSACVRLSVRLRLRARRCSCWRQVHRSALEMPPGRDRRLLPHARAGDHPRELIR